MISLPCTNCQKTLTVDEAFAGGVCRCQHCGTIQTVPAHLKEGPDKAGPPAKTLYKHPSRSDSAVGTGLQNLSDDATASTRAPKLKGRRASAPGELPPQPIPWPLYAAAAGIALLGILLIWLLLTHS